MELSAEKILEALSKREQNTERFDYLGRGRLL